MVGRHKEFCKRGHLMAETRWVSPTNKRMSLCSKCRSLRTRRWYNSSHRTKPLEDRERTGAKHKEFCKRGHLMAETRYVHVVRTGPHVGAKISCCGECKKLRTRQTYSRHSKQYIEQKRKHNDNPAFREGKRRQYWANRDKISKRRKELRAANPEKSRARNLMGFYGITLEEYDAMLKSQKGLCAVCDEKPAPDTRLSVDHDHVDKRVRGLLCDSCNKGIGLLKDSPEIVTSALQYLRKHAQLRLVS